MIRTRGLTHIELSVRDAERRFRFYQPYIFFADPDGYEVEVWYETPTTGDPPTSQPHSLNAHSNPRTSRSLT